MATAKEAASVQLSDSVRSVVWLSLQTSLHNLSHGQLRCYALANAGNDTEYTYTVMLTRRGGYKPTKAQVEWARTVLETTGYLLR